MSWELAALLAGLLGAFVTWLLLKDRGKAPDFSLIQQQLTSLSEQMNRMKGDVATTNATELDRLHQRVDQRLKETAEMVQGSHQTMGQRISESSKLFAQVQERLAHMEEANRQVAAVGQEVAKLHEILRAPKLRGNLGELFLEELLAQILPRKFFEMQYSFRSGEKVDAVIRLPEKKLVPIDAKFPLENFQKMVATETDDSAREGFRKLFVSDFKRHVDNIASKYIRPDEGTLDFALLYVPAENVYYEAILRDEQLGQARALNTYALNKKVIPVSPNTIYAYLQAILMGLRGLQVEAKAEEILQFLSRLRLEIARLQEEFSLVGKHLGNAGSAYEKTEKRLSKIADRVGEIGHDKGAEAIEEVPARMLHEPTV